MTDITKIAEALRKCVRLLESPAVSACFAYGWADATEYLQTRIDAHAILSEFDATRQEPAPAPGMVDCRVVNYPDTRVDLGATRQELADESPHPPDRTCGCEDCWQYFVGKQITKSFAPVQVGTGQDPADIIAGHLQCSRGYAYELMEEAVASRYPAQVGTAEVLTDEEIKTALVTLDMRPPSRLPPGWLAFARSIERIVRSRLCVPSITSTEKDSN